MHAEEERKKGGAVPTSAPQTLVPAGRPGHLCSGQVITARDWYLGPGRLCVPGCVPLLGSGGHSTTVVRVG